MKKIIAMAASCFPACWPMPKQAGEVVAMNKAIHQGCV